MARNSFSRSNVNEKMLEISQPSRSSFDLGSTNDSSLPLGKYIPVRCEHLIPSAVLVGSISPEMTLKEIGVPQIGPLRLDTHTIAVSKRRINKDWVKVVKGSATSQPSFEADVLFGVIAQILLTSDHSFSLDNVPSFSTIISSLVTGTPPTNLTLTFILRGLFNRAASFYYQQVNSSDDVSCYNKDFYMMEHLRLSQLASRFPEGASVTLADYDPWYALFEIMKPYFGSGSIMDRLGFPSFLRLGRSYQWLTQYKYAYTNPEAVTQITFTYLNGFNIKLTDVLRVSYYSLPTSGPNPTVEYADSLYYRCSEWDIRASYAAWYDSLRNWHVEEADKLPNPDDWYTQSILEGGRLLSTVPVYFGQLCCFLIPRYRDYQNDLFSTIQTDDVFRHIFAPIFTQSDDYISQNGDLSQGSYDNILSLISSIDSALNVVFPFGIFNRSAYASNDNYGSSYVNDLQTMRRAGMLEKWCARNYFFPDTFEGKMKARYGISANDLLGVTSEYIEGGESFITGQQTINPTETAEMPAGSRTFQGGSALTGDTFSFAAGGDDVILVTFCSWMPLVTYSATNPHLSELSAADVVAPEFATDTRVQIQAMNLVRDMEHVTDFIGFVPRYVTYRARLNEVHGEFLDEKRSFVWLRDWYSTTIRNGNGKLLRLPYYSQFAINAYDMRVRMPLDGFLDLQPWDEISYGRITFAYSIDLPLPAAVEFI